MSKMFSVCVVALVACCVLQSAAGPVLAGCPCGPGGSMALCEVPVTRCYGLEPGFCPQQIAAMIPQAVGPDPSCGCCGPFGIPPIYCAGNAVVVRASRETHKEVAKFLADMGASFPLKRTKY